MLGYSKFLMHGLDGLCGKSGDEAWGPGLGGEGSSSRLDQGLKVPEEDAPSIQ